MCFWTIAFLWAASGAVGWGLVIQRFGFDNHFVDWLMLPLGMFVGPIALGMSIGKVYRSTLT
jgi:hypothetical protein